MGLRSLEYPASCTSVRRLAIFAFDNTEYWLPCWIIILSWLLIALAVSTRSICGFRTVSQCQESVLGFLVTILFSSLLRTAASSLTIPLAQSIEIARCQIHRLEFSRRAWLILLIRWVYWLIRRREGLGLGDAKLMALLAAWLGFPLALLSLSLGVVLGALLALFVLVIPRPESDEQWALLKMPLGTFLCIGGIISALWGQAIIAAYMRWAGF